MVSPRGAGGGRRASSCAGEGAAAAQPQARGTRRSLACGQRLARPDGRQRLAVGKSPPPSRLAQGRHRARVAPGCRWPCRRSEAPLAQGWGGGPRRQCEAAGERTEEGGAQQASGAPAAAAPWGRDLAALSPPRQVRYLERGSRSRPASPCLRAPAGGRALAGWPAAPGRAHRFGFVSARVGGAAHFWPEGRGQSCARAPFSGSKPAAAALIGRCKRARRAPAGLLQRRTRLPVGARALLAGLAPGASVPRRQILVASNCALPLFVAAAGREGVPQGLDRGRSCSLASPLAFWRACRSSHGPSVLRALRLILC